MGRTTDAILVALVLGVVACPTVTTSPSTPTDTGDTPPATTATGDTGPTTFPPADEDWMPFVDRTWQSPHGAGGLAAGDLDGDGVAELLVEVVAGSQKVNPPTCEGSEYVGWSGAALLEGLPASGAVESVARTTWRLDPVFADASHDCGPPGAPGDVTGDGVADVTLWCNDQETGWSGLAVLDSSVSGVQAYDPIVAISRISGTWDAGLSPAVPCGDVDGDGASDLCYGTVVFRGPLPPTVDWATYWLSVSDNGNPSSAASDLDGDGRVDLIYGSGYQGVLTLFAAPDPGDYLKAEADVSWTDPDWAEVDGADDDLDGDGAPDIVAHSLAGQHVLTDRNGGTFDDAAVFFEGGSFGATGDFDGDGAADLWTATVQPDWPRTMLFLGPLPGGTLTEDGAAAIVMTTDDPNPAYQAWHHVKDQVAADLDGDGLDDLAASFAGQVAVVLGSSL